MFNVYNEITNNDTLEALDLFYEHNKRLIRPTNSDSVLWLGDFNWHHPMWEDDSNERLFKSEEFIAPLINLLYKCDMVLALHKGIPTLQTPAGNWIRPDNIWHGSTPEDPSSDATGKGIQKRNWPLFCMVRTSGLACKLPQADLEVLTIQNNSQFHFQIFFCSSGQTSGSPCKLPQADPEVLTMQNNGQFHFWISPLFVISHATPHSMPPRIYVVSMCNVQ